MIYIYYILDIDTDKPIYLYRIIPIHITSISHARLTSRSLAQISARFRSARCDVAT